MKPELVEYGIADEKSDIRAHVSFPGRQVVVFQTERMQELVKQKSYRKGKATQPNVDGTVTGVGLLVPIADIEPKFILTSGRFPWDDYDHTKMDLAQRGDAAVACVRAAIRANKFPLWVCGLVETDKEIDIQGTDIVVNAGRRIQVKYDWGAYPIAKGGTGNLFIQTMECNPNKIYGAETLNISKSPR